MNSPLRIKLRRATFHAVDAPLGVTEPGWICHISRHHWMRMITHTGGARTIREALAAALRDEATCEMCRGDA